MFVDVSFLLQIHHSSFGNTTNRGSVAKRCRQIPLPSEQPGRIAQQQRIRANSRGSRSVRGQKLEQKNSEFEKLAAHLASRENLSKNKMQCSTWVSGRILRAPS